MPAALLYSITNWFIIETMKSNHKISIRTLIIVLFSSIATVSILTVGAYCTYKTITTMVEREVIDTTHNMEFIGYKVNDIIEDKHLGALRLAYEDPIVTYLYNINTGIPNDDEVELETVKRAISYYKTGSITSVKLISKDGTTLEYAPAYLSTLKEWKNEDQIPKDTDKYYLFDSWQDATWYNGEAVIPYTRVIIDNDRKQTVGYLVANVKESVFNKAFKDYETQDNTRFFLVNKNGTIQSCTDKKLFSLNIKDALGFGLDRLEKDSGYFDLRKGAEWSLVTYIKDNTNANGLSIIALVPVSNVLKTVKPIIAITLIIVLFCVLACVYTSIVVSQRVTNPLNKLIDRISVRGYEHADKKENRNEVDILSNQYESLLKELEEVINQYYEEQLMKREAEIRALEFQINPHFLYNTLSTIIWLIEQNDSKKAIDIIKKLSAFYRLSISRGVKYIKIRNELQHAGIYIDIQNSRYAGRIRFEKDVDISLYDYYVPKLILQPLIENSINHAALEGQATEGIIRIVGYIKGEFIFLEVWDNGESMSDEKLDEMNEFLHDKIKRKSNSKYGIGISNVHDRISMSFGDDYGLCYRRENRMTIASLKLKIMKEEDI